MLRQINISKDEISEYDLDKIFNYSVEKYRSANINDLTLNIFLDKVSVFSITPENFEKINEGKKSVSSLLGWDFDSNGKVISTFNEDLSL